MNKRKIDTLATASQQAVTGIAGLLPKNPEQAFLPVTEAKLLPAPAGTGQAATPESSAGIGGMIVGAAERTADAVHRTVAALGRLAVRTTEAVVDATVRTTVAGTKATFFAGCWGVGMSAGLVLGGMWAFETWGDLRQIRDDNLTAFNMSQWKSQMEAKEKTLLACEEDAGLYREKYLTARLQAMLVEKGLAVEYMWQPDFQNNTYTVKVKSAKAKEEVHCYGKLHLDEKGADLTAESATDIECPNGTPAQLVRVAAEATKSATPKRTVVVKPSSAPTPTP